MKNLYCVQVALLVCAVLSAIPLVGTVFNWVNSILSAFVVYILYQLSPVKDRYRKAAIFTGISVVAGLLTRFVDLGEVTLAVSICSLVGLYGRWTIGRLYLGMLDK